MAIVGLVLGYIAIALMVIGMVLGGAALIWGESATQEMIDEMERMPESMPPPESSSGPGM